MPDIPRPRIRSRGTMNAEPGAEGHNRPINQKVLLSLIGVTAVALLVFATLSVFFYYQSEDFRTSKYKAQYVAVENVVDAVPLMNDAVAEVLDDTLDNGYRRSAAKYVQATAEAISGSCNVIGVMYPSGDARSETFLSLSASFAELAGTAEEAYNQLTDPTPEVSTEVSTALDSSADIAASIGVLVYEGVDPEVDWMESPYDLLDGMDIDALAALAADLQAAQP